MTLVITARDHGWNVPTLTSNKSKQQVEGIVRLRLVVGVDVS